MNMYANIWKLMETMEADRKIERKIDRQIGR